MLNQVAEGVWVRQSEWVWSNATVVRGEGGLILVDPGIDDALRRGEDPVDARLGQDWLSGPHQSNLDQARQRHGLT
jgi:hypothetical protein